MDPIVGRKTWRTLEPIHAMIYFVPEATEAYEAIGLKGNRMGYFASRAAAMGPVPAEVVVATFYNFCPTLVHQAIPAAWTLAEPATICDARLLAVDRALRRAFSAEILMSAQLAEAAGLARRAAEAAAGRLHGRPLFAAQSSLPWPEEAHLILWQAQSLLREFRGDGHVASLLLAELDPVEALVTHAAAGDIPAGVLQVSRAWPDDDWVAGVERLRSRGVLASSEELTLTDEGRVLRQRVEDATDELAAAAYAALGDEACARLRQLGRPLSQAIMAAGMVSANVRRIVDSD